MFYQQKLNGFTFLINNSKRGYYDPYSSESVNVNGSVMLKQVRILSHITNPTNRSQRVNVLSRELRERVTCSIRSCKELNVQSITVRVLISH